MTDRRTAAMDLGNLKQKNAGKLQFNAVREEVLALLAESRSRRALHTELREKGVFTGSYRRFCEYVQGIEKKEHGNPQPEPAADMAETAVPAAPEQSAPQPAQPARAEQPTNGFIHTSTPNINDLA